jgi:hypothetical protein
MVQASFNDFSEYVVLLQTYFGYTGVRIVSISVRYNLLAIIFEAFKSHIINDPSTSRIFFLVYDIVKKADHFFRNINSKYQKVVLTSDTSAYVLFDIPADSHIADGVKLVQFDNTQVEYTKQQKLERLNYMLRVKQPPVVRNISMNHVVIGRTDYKGVIYVANNLQRSTYNPKIDSKIYQFRTDERGKVRISNAEDEFACKYVYISTVTDFEAIVAIQVDVVINSIQVSYPTRFTQMLDLIVTNEITERAYSIQITSPQLRGGVGFDYADSSFVLRPTHYYSQNDKASYFSVNNDIYMVHFLANQEWQNAFRKKAEFSNHYVFGSELVMFNARREKKFVQDMSFDIHEGIAIEVLNDMSRMTIYKDAWLELPLHTHKKHTYSCLLPDTQVTDALTILRQIGVVDDCVYYLADNDVEDENRAGFVLMQQQLKSPHSILLTQIDIQNVDYSINIVEVDDTKLAISLELSVKLVRKSDMTETESVIEFSQLAEPIRNAFQQNPRLMQYVKLFGHGMHYGPMCIGFFANGDMLLYISALLSFVIATKSSGYTAITGKSAEIEMWKVGPRISHQATQTNPREEAFVFIGYERRIYSINSKLEIRYVVPIYVEPELTQSVDGMTRSYVDHILSIFAVEPDYIVVYIQIPGSSYALIRVFGTNGRRIREFRVVHTAHVAITKNGLVRIYEERVMHEFDLVEALKPIVPKLSFLAHNTIVQEPDINQKVRDNLRLE